MKQKWKKSCISLGYLDILETIQSSVCRVSAMKMMITINSKGFTGVQDLKELETIQSYVCRVS